MHREKDPKEDWGDNAALFLATVNVKRIRQVSINMYWSFHVVVEAFCENFRKFDGQPILGIVIKRPSLMTKSKALVRSTKAT